MINILSSIDINKMEEVLKIKNKSQCCFRLHDCNILCVNTTRGNNMIKDAILSYFHEYSSYYKEYIEEYRNSTEARQHFFKRLKEDKEKDLFED
jgi:hypothetical protein